jgi:hypothetical protein
MPHTSREAKFASERYILVAAIVTDIIQGVWNICVAERRKRSIYHSKQTRTYEAERHW